MRAWTPKARTSELRTLREKEIRTVLNTIHNNCEEERVKLGGGFLPPPKQRCALGEAKTAHTKYLGASSPSGNARGGCRVYIEKLCIYIYTEYTQKDDDTFNFRSRERQTL